MILKLEAVRCVRHCTLSPQPKLAWIPACAGMTAVESSALTSNDMPAKAGIHASLPCIATLQNAATGQLRAKP